MRKKKIGIIGCGNMGQAILERLILAAKRPRILVSDADRAKRNRIRRIYGVRVTDDNVQVAVFADVVVLAVKPQDIGGVLRQIAKAISERKTVVSIAAGVTTKRIESGLSGGKVPVVRVMPNMPALVGEAISALCRGRYAKRSHIEAAKRILSSIGETIEVREDHIDAVTAVSGSGPAYFFYLIESMIESAIELGLSGDAARKLVEKTALGSARAVSQLRIEPAELRRRVTSKGGTTEAALKVFRSEDFKGIVKRAIKRAKVKAGELSS